MITIWLLCVLGALKIALASNPVFILDSSNKKLSILVPSDVAIGSVIYRLRVTDEDSNYPLEFKIYDGATIVQVYSLPCKKHNSKCQANIVLQARLEMGQTYDFQVSAQDTEGEMTMQNCSITVTNSKTHMEQVFLKRSRVLNLPENTKVGSELDYVVVRKNPSLPRQAYLELWGSSHFAIRSQSITSALTNGTIILIEPLDFEKQSIFYLTLLAIDAYTVPGRDNRNAIGIEIIVNVKDVQDVAPIFINAPPVTRLPSDLMPGDEILQVHAIDGDKGISREIRYGLVFEGNPFTSFFSINDSTGVMTLMFPLEKMLASTNVGKPVLLTVIAEEIMEDSNELPAMATSVELALLLPERNITSSDLQTIPTNPDAPRNAYWFVIIIAVLFNLGILALLFSCIWLWCPGTPGKIFGVTRYTVNEV